MLTLVDTWRSWNAKGVPPQAIVLTRHSIELHIGPSPITWSQERSHPSTPSSCSINFHMVALTMIYRS